MACRPMLAEKNYGQFTSSWVLFFKIQTINWWQILSLTTLHLGQKQRVAIAGVLAMRPRYLLLDEPTTMLSGQTARQMLNTVQRLSRERGITILHITNFMHEITAFERVIVMDAGRILM